ncbi:cell migration-inducing and hyaluronan-binding protein-like isoform X2 [Pecten maximus]|uniref:cell migration-inducing and hyaluronan-binding protein-like isoform X2 n=1 Tax=Pecten maximus TaxID=6579 RepID=UPI0014587075|nr:cell migration-inducing and hyaluronan-binding protein-like isoform X2 [Pecten maximus]
MLSNPLFAILVVATLQTTYAVTCPYDDSDLGSWPADAATGTLVKISTKVLLDKTLTEEFAGIEIENGGALVFAPNIADGIVLRTSYILIKDGGRMDIGADGCRYEGSLNIQLLGERTTTINIPSFGDKFIGVESGGHLNIWGTEQVAWTSLTSTLQKMPDTGFAFAKQVTQDDAIQGFITYQFNPAQDSFTDADVNEKVYNFKTSSQDKFSRTVDTLKADLDAVPDQYVVIAAIRKSLMAENDVKDFEPLYKVIEDFLQLDEGKSKLRTLEFYDGYVMLMKKGGSYPAIEETSDYRLNGLHQECELIKFDGDLKFYAKSYTRIKAHGQSYIEVEATLREYSEPTIAVAKHSFKADDSIVIAPTGSDPEEHEYATVTEVIDSTHVKIDLTVRHEHKCETDKGVFKCAEVALLNRNVHVEGITFGDDLYGGNIKCLAGFGSCNFVDFELSLMGQQFPLGRYPIHFHLGDVVTGNGLVKSLSIHDTYARCVTVHRTNNLIVTGNICVKFLGHGYFLEDGDEIGNTFTDNLALLPIKPNNEDNTFLIPSDKKPSGFFITHPNNKFEGNHAVGSEGHGFYLVFPESPTGNAAPLNNLVAGEASRTNIALFTKNTAHSNLMDGVRFDDYLDSTGEVKSGSGYNARVDPKDSSSALVLTELSCITSYNNGESNVHVRTAKASLTNIAVAKAKRGITLLRGINNERFEQTVKNCVILGDRESADEAVDEDDTDYRVGLEFTGPVSLSQLYFNDFYKTTVYRSGAIGFNDGNRHSIIGNEIGDDVYFGFTDATDGNRVLPPDVAEDGDGNRAESFIDAGDVTDSNSPLTVLRSFDFQTTDKCYRRENWDYSVCDEEYQMVSINTAATIARVDNEANYVYLPGGVLPSSTPFNAIVDKQQYHYLFRFDNNDFSSSVNVKLIGGNNGNKVFGCCVPPGAETRVQYSSAERFTAVGSYSDLATSTEKNYFLDKTAGVLFFNVLGQDNNDACSSDFDTTGVCRTVKVKVTNSVTGINDCFADAEQYTPPSPATMTIAEKRLLKLIAKLARGESESSRSKKTALKRTLSRRSVEDPDRVFAAYTGAVPAGYGTCSATRK